MKLMARILAWLFPDPPAVTGRPRRLRMTCPGCGKSLAVIASTHELWKHKCEKPTGAAHEGN